MIRTFRHNGLEQFFRTGSVRGIQPKHEKRLRLQLEMVNRARHAEAMKVPGWKFHALKGDHAGHWAVWVDGNWRMTFTFEGEDAILVDYQDYH